MSWVSQSPAETVAFGRALAGVTPAAGAVIVLSGPLGAGKTVFAKGLAAGLGLDPDALASPTFVIANEYPTADAPVERLVHVDCYRVEDAGELEMAGLHDWLAPGTLVVVEWGERFPEAWPAGHLRVGLSGRGDARQLDLVGSGPLRDQAAAALDQAR